MDIHIKFILVVLIEQINIKELTCKEYCHFENFQPSCERDHVIIMTEAKYGQMELGNCIKKDLGYVGCQGDVLNFLDEECSGRQTCDIRVSSREMSSKSLCEDGLLQYLWATYSCKKALQITPLDCRNSNIKIEDESVIITSSLIESCLPLNTAVKVTAQLGQNINVSLIDMHDSADQTYGNRVYGTLKDVKSDYQMQFGSGKRYQHLISSTENMVELTLATNTDLFAIEFHVQGCVDMPPPNGAWMTRDGDVMEIGCHSGKHVWRLRCDDGQWVGAIGACGAVIGETFPDIDIAVNESATGISTNLVVFGICSLIILASSIVFLVGVLFLKRHNATKYGDYTYQPGAPLVPMTNNFMAFESLPKNLANDKHCGRDENWMTKSQDYKSLQIQ